MIEMCSSAVGLLDLMLTESNSPEADAKFRNRCRSHAATMLRRKLYRRSESLDEAPLLMRVLHRSDALSILQNHTSDRKSSATEMLAVVRKDLPTNLVLRGIRALARTTPENTRKVWQYSNRVLRADEITAVQHYGIVSVLWHVPWQALEATATHDADVILSHISQFFGSVYDSCLKDCLSPHNGRAVVRQLGTLAMLDVMLDI